MSIDWYVAVEYWGLSSIIGDAWGFSSIAFIAPSRGFSIEILTGV